MTAVAKVFKNGRSQAVRLPKEFRVKGTEVYLRHTPKGILITERPLGSASRGESEIFRQVFDRLGEAEEAASAKAKGLAQ